MLRELFSSGKGLLLTFFCSAWAASPRWRFLLQSSALGHVPSVAAPRLQSAGSVAVVLGLSCSSARGIFLTRGPWSQMVSCMGRQTLYHEATREVPPCGMTDAFLMISLGSRSGEENHGSVKCQSPQPPSRLHAINRTVDADLDSWLRQGLSGFLTTKLTLFLSLSCCSF